LPSLQTSAFELQHLAPRKRFLNKDLELSTGGCLLRSRDDVIYFNQVYKESSNLANLHLMKA